MPIFKGSRYRFSNVIQVEDANGDVNGVYVLRESTDEVPDGSIPYQVGAKDTLESISFAFYGDGNKWYVLADVNPHIFFPLDLTPGEIIYIPPKSYAISV